MDHITVSQALDQLFHAATPIAEVEIVTLSASLGRTLAEDLRAPLAVPHFDRAAMDGYALHAADAPGDLILGGSIAAGQILKTRCDPGCAIRILTGAPIPLGADTVVEQEQVHAVGNRVHVPLRIRAGRNISQTGSEFAAGDIILRQGQRIGPTEIAMFAAIGCEEVPVFRAPRVLLITTGDELTLPGSPLSQSHIYDVNRFLLASWLSAAGARVTSLPIIGDQTGLFMSELQNALSSEVFDLVISSGGVSVGDRDDVIHSLTHDAELLFWRVDMHPGKSVAGARLQNTPILALSGNPGAAMTSWVILGTPLIAHLNHGALYQEHIRGRLHLEFNKPTRETRYLRVRTHTDADGLVFDWGLPQQSDVLGSFSTADAFAIIPRKSPGIPTNIVLDGLRTGGLGPMGITWSAKPS